MKCGYGMLWLKSWATPKETIEKFRKVHPKTLLELGIFVESSKRTRCCFCFSQDTGDHYKIPSVSDLDKAKLRTLSKGPTVPKREAKAKQSSVWSAGVKKRFLAKKGGTKTVEIHGRFRKLNIRNSLQDLGGVNVSPGITPVDSVEYVMV